MIGRCRGIAMTAALQCSKAHEQTLATDRRVVSHATRSFWDADFAPGDALMFGSESVGAPPWLHGAIDPATRFRVNHPRPRLRSLSFATCVGVPMYEALQ